jgi:hypothetical protein
MDITHQPRSYNWVGNRADHSIKVKIGGGNQCRNLPKSFFFSRAFCDVPLLLLVKLSNELRQIKTIEISLVRLAVVRCTAADGV